VDQGYFTNCVMENNNFGFIGSFSHPIVQQTLKQKHLCQQLNNNIKRSIYSLHIR